jgi:hypothetical protein
VSWSGRKGFARTIARGCFLATLSGSLVSKRKGIRRTANLRASDIDDPLKPDQALSEVGRKTVNEWYDNTLLSRLNNKRTGCIIIVMQRATHALKAVDLTFEEGEIHAIVGENGRETQVRFHDATGPIVTSVLAVTMWQLGEVGRARELIDQATRRAIALDHAPSMAHPLFWKSHLEILRGDATAALIAAEALERLGREHGLPFWRTFGELSAGWARGRLYDAAAGAADLGRALAERADQGARVGSWFYTVLLAELEAEMAGPESALARIDEAMALAREVENRCNLAFPHLLRGELLLKRDPSNAASAEEAFRTALAIAKEQGARSWGLRAALCEAVIELSGPNVCWPIKLAAIPDRRAADHIRTAPSLALDTCAAYSARTPSL